MKWIKSVLVAGGILILIVTIYQSGSVFKKGWNDADDPIVLRSEFHSVIFDDVITTRADSLNITGKDGYIYKLKADYRVNGDVFNLKDSGQRISFLEGFNFSLTVTILVLGILILGNLYYFIDDSSRGDIFTLKNINRIKIIGYYCISLSVALFIWDLVSFFIAKEIFSHTEYQVSYEFDFNYLMFTVGVVTILIMHVFKKGYELKQEHELTI
ncbi:DUF2975 domain-containing protein [Pedobacter metabolipauper]|nr:DUF2975 domain-containing protein [Pedobacter metabolipauper]